MQPASSLSRTARRVYGALAGVLWFGVALSLVLDILHIYPTTETNPHLLAFTDASVFDRVVDLSSYFTIWSNALAAFVLTQLALGHWTGTERERVLRADSLLMMSVTGIVYSYLLAGERELQGLQHLTNAIQHYWGPALVVATWAVFGPRGWLKPSHIVTALAIPIVWLLYSLARGAAISAYPYPFVDVLEYGYGPVLTTIAMIVAFGMTLAAIFVGLDRLLGRFVGAGASKRVA
jgi:hypothetical protein